MIRSMCMCKLYSKQVHEMCLPSHLSRIMRSMSTPCRSRPSCCVSSRSSCTCSSSEDIWSFTSRRSGSGKPGAGPFFFPSINYIHKNYTLYLYLLQENLNTGLNSGAGQDVKRKYTYVSSRTL